MRITLLDMGIRYGPYGDRPEPVAVARVREFLGSYVHDCDGLEDLRRHLLRSRRDLCPFAEAIDELLARPPAAGTLAWLVAIDGNWSLDDGGSDADAAALLREIAGVVRDAIRESD